MERSLPLLADVPIARLRAEAPWRAVDFDALAASAPFPKDPSVADLIAGGESATVEFKSTARWDVVQNAKSRVMEGVILKTIAGFLNSHDGGTLLIGVQDGGSVCGIETDFGAWSKPADRDRDGSELWLIGGLLLQHFGMDRAPFLRVTFHSVDDLTVCQVDARPSDRPVYVRDGNNVIFHLRTGNQTEALPLDEAVQYIASRWPR